MNKLVAAIHEDKLEDFEAWFRSELAGRKETYNVDSFEPDPKSTGVIYSVSVKIGRQADIERLKQQLAQLNGRLLPEGKGTGR